MIEHESHSHGHHTGLPYVDLIVAGSAILISVISLVVSIHHGRTMEKLVAANEKQVEASTLPIIRFTTGKHGRNCKSGPLRSEEWRYRPGNYRVVPNQMERPADQWAKRFAGPLLPPADAAG